ncbi:hypothetical protein HPT25_26535 [Bacillus sp. BRMEA1]|uniref:LPD1 domain-containing protein n=1 Tax=Neobacillus endophyticus TaxID=2738405 RepID=UPI001565FEAD|nr:LPD1 domain-containing protein [Neobacillus endophyticus]NRD80890.1 hypothetical protein [Neobacillus endophyticus]
MSQSQLSLFGAFEETKNIESMMDVRSEVQANRKVAYDVGTRIGGSRKDEYALRRQFLEEKNIDVLSEIESESAVLAAELISKKELFSDFSLEAERDNGVDCKVARLKQLLIQRIDAQPEDAEESRKDFFLATQELNHRFSSLITMDQFRDFIEVMNTQMIYEGSSGTYTANRIKELEETLANTDDDDIQTISNTERQLRRAKERLAHIREANKYNFRILGDSFKNFFTKQQSLNSTLKAVSKIKSWDELLAPKKSKSTGKNKPVWERMLPERPDRIGGRESNVSVPEDMLRDFGFKAVEFGHYMEDSKGLEHIYRCSEAFHDLADLLGVSDHALSLNGTLSLSFGGRGRGRAIGHFEPKFKVINFTKERGTLGICSHEFFHSLDHHLYCISYDQKNGHNGYLSNLDTVGPHIPTELVNAMRDLMKEIKEGSSIAYFQNENKPETSWRIGYSLKNLYKWENGNLQAIMENYKTKLDDSYKYHVSMLSYINRDKEMEKLDKRKMRELKKYAQALAWYHQQQTGERVEEIPYPSDKSMFLQQAIGLDRGKNGYWSSNVELIARAFEAWVQDKLKEQGRVSDYLVCGTYDSIAYPMGEEREKINKKMDVLMKQIVDTVLF